MDFPQMMVVVYKEIKGVMQTLKFHERSTSRPAKSSARNCACHGQVGLSFKAVKVFTISNKAMVIQPGLYETMAWKVVRSCCTYLACEN